MYGLLHQYKDEQGKKTRIQHQGISENETLRIYGTYSDPAFGK